MVAVRRRRPRAVRWTEVGAVERARMGRRARRRGFVGINPDTLRGYQLRLRDGSSVFLFAADAFGTGKLLRADFEQQATAAGLPIAG